MGLKMRCFDYIGNREEGGHAVTSAKVYIEGEVDLKDDKCAATSAGFVELYSTVLPEEVRAFLTDAQGASSQDEFDQLGWSFVLEFEIGLNASTGLGKYSDMDQNANRDGDDVFHLTIKSRHRIQIETWAYEPQATGSSAEVTAYHYGCTSSQTTLSDA